MKIVEELLQGTGNAVLGRLVRAIRREEMPARRVKALPQQIIPLEAEGSMMTEGTLNLRARMGCYAKSFQQDSGDGGGMLFASLPCVGHYPADPSMCPCDPTPPAAGKSQTHWPPLAASSREKACRVLWLQKAIV